MKPMIKKSGLNKTVFFLLLFIGGCATFESKIGSKHRDDHDMLPQFGYIYSGVVSSMGNWCYLVSPNMKHSSAFIVAPLVVVFGIFDSPLTLLADTLLLPFELGSDPAYPRLTLEDECNYSRIDLSEDYNLPKKDGSNPSSPDR